MKGMILAAGYGTRMGPISSYLAKPAIPFLGVPMIEHSIGVLRSGGIKDIIINIHHQPDSLINLLGSGSRLGVKIEYSFEEPILASGGGIGNVRNFFDEETFVVVNSDIIVDVDLNSMIEAHKAEDVAATLGTLPGYLNLLPESYQHTLPGYPLSKYMQRFLDEGKPIYFMHYQRDPELCRAQLPFPAFERGFRVRWAEAENG